MHNIKIKIILYITFTLLFTVLIVLLKPDNNQSVYEKDWFWINKTYPYKKFDIVIYGDSRVYRGISPEKFSEVFPSADIINLGYSSGGINKQALEFALDKLGNNESKILVLGITPFSLTEKARQNKHLLQELNRPTGEVLERKYIYPFLTAFEPIEINPFKLPENYQMKYHPTGWVESYKIKEDTTEALESYIKQFSETKLSQNSIAELETFIKEQKSNGIKIFGFRPPASFSLEKIENEYSSFNEKEIRELFIRNGAYWIEIPSRYSYHTYDGSHLHYLSAKKPSFFIAQQIKYKIHLQ